MAKPAFPHAIVFTAALVILFAVFAGPAGSLRLTTAGATKPQETNDPVAYNAKGLEAYKEGKYDEAVKAYKQALKLRKDYAEAHFNLGNAYFELGKNKEAVDAYKQALRYQPTFPDVYMSIGKAYVAADERKKAIEAYKEAIRFDPKSGQAYYNLGSVYFHSQDKQAALNQYQILKTIDPKLAHELYLLIYEVKVGVFSGTGVRLNVMAVGAQGSLATDLKQEDFQVFEDGVPQNVTSFSVEKYPLVYGIAIDSSGSMREAFPYALQLSKAIIEGNGSNDETLLIRFISSDKIETIQEFTSDKQKLADEIDLLYIEGGQSAVIDGIYLAAQRVAQYKPENSSYLRRAVFLITDGEDRASYYNSRQLGELVRQIDVQVFVICLNKEEGKKSQLNTRLAKGAFEFLTTLANETGGNAFFPKSLTELGGIVKQLNVLSRTQYLVGYQPAKSSDTNTYHRVKVTVTDKAGRDKIQAFTRAGYVIQKPVPAP